MRLEDGLAAVLDGFLTGRNQRHDKTIQSIFGAVVGVQCDRDGVVFGGFLGERGKSQRTRGAGRHTLSGKEVSTPGGNLNDAVRTCFGQTLKHRVDGRRGRHVEGGVGKTVAFCPIEHRGVLVGGSNRHGFSSYRGWGFKTIGTLEAPLYRR